MRTLSILSVTVTVICPFVISHTSATVLLSQNTLDFHVIPAGGCAIFEVNFDSGGSTIVFGVKLWETNGGSSSLEYMAVSLGASSNYNSPSAFQSCDGESFDIETCWDNMEAIRSSGFLSDTCYNGSFVPPIVVDMTATNRDSASDNMIFKSSECSTGSGRSYVYVKNSNAKDTVVAIEISDLPFDCSSGLIDDDDMCSSKLDACLGWKFWVPFAIAGSTALSMYCWIARSCFNIMFEKPSSGHLAREVHTTECRFVEQDEDPEPNSRGSSFLMTSWWPRKRGLRQEELQVAVERHRGVPVTPIVLIQPERAHVCREEDENAESLAVSSVENVSISDPHRQGNSANLESEAPQGALPIAERTAEWDQIENGTVRLDLTFDLVLDQQYGQGRPEGSTLGIRI